MPSIVAVERTCDFFEWLFGASLTPASRRRIEGVLEVMALNDDASEGKLLRKVKDLHAKLVDLSDEDRERERPKVLSEMLGWLRERPDSDAAVLLLRFYDMAHDAIAEGTPPLTSLAAEGFAEAVADVGHFSPHDEPARRRVLAWLVDQYPLFSSEAQLQVSRIGLAYGFLQRIERDLLPGEREALVEDVRAVVDAVMGWYRAATAAPAPPPSVDYRAERAAIARRGWAVSNLMSTMGRPPALWSSALRRW